MTEPAPHLEIERRFLIGGVPPDSLWPVPFLDTRIVQTYLTVPPWSPPGATERVRARTPLSPIGDEAAVTVYTHTTKEPLKKHMGEKLFGSKEYEREIPEAVYVNLLRRASPEHEPLHKVRRVFTWAGMIMELDTYPTLDNEFKNGPLRILEVELGGHDSIFTIPDWLSPAFGVREVTGDDAYSNVSLARKPSS